VILTMSDPYSSVPSTGKLKLKGGIKDSKVDKKRKKRSKPKIEGEDGGGEELKEKSVMLRSLEEEDARIPKESSHETSLVDGKQVGPGAGAAVEDASNERIKTETEKRFDEQRRKRLDDRLKREGVKTHKQRVEELNRYLSGLSEHHDMPRIGPG
jgi:protein FAM32A